MKNQVTASEYTDLSDDLKAEYGEAQDGKHTLKLEGLEIPDVKGLKQKVEDLLTEKKDEQEKRRKAEEKTKQAEKDQARKKGDFESLLDSAEKENTKLKESLAKRDERDAKKDIKVMSTECSAKLAEGTDQELIATFLRQRMRSVDGEIKITDKEGNLTISTPDQLVEEFRNDARYASLITGTKAAGGGAKGTQNGGAVKTKTITRSVWNDMSHVDRAAAQKDGASVIDD